MRRMCMQLSDTHTKIYQAVRAKAEANPGTVALIGVYGSACTGELHEKSDLDLLIVPTETADCDVVRSLCTIFLLSDTGIGYDIYLTPWEALENDVNLPSAHLAKLMDSEILWCDSPASLERLTTLRQRVAENLLSDMRYDRAVALYKEAKAAFGDMMLAETDGEARFFAGEMLYYILQSVMLYHGKYYRRSSKHTLDELGNLPLPTDFTRSVLAVAVAENLTALWQASTTLLKMAGFVAYPKRREEPSAENLTGTYEEMVSNWGGKMEEAVARHDRFSSFMNMVSLEAMLNELQSQVDIPVLSPMEEYRPADPVHNAAVFQKVLTAYHSIYDSVGVSVRTYPDADGFVADYLVK